MTIQNKGAFYALEEVNASIRVLYFFQGYEKGGDALGEFLGGIDDKHLTEAFGFDTSEYPDTDRLVEALDDHGLLGHFIAEVHTPVKTKFGKHGTIGFSWGHTHYTVIVGKDFKEIVEKTVEWAKKQEVKE